MALTDSKAEMGHVQEVGSETSNTPPVKRSFGTRVKNHYKKWWWAHLILVVVCTLVIVLPLVYVGFPRIAQDNINKSSLSVNSLSVTDPTPTTFHLRQNATVHNPSKYHPQLDAFDATLALTGGSEYATIRLPQLHATRDAISIADQTVTITNLTAFTLYNAAVLSSKSVSVTIKGRTPLHEMKFPTTTVDYNKQVTLAGLDNFRGFNVTNFTISLTPDPVDGSNMLGTVLIPNPSDMTLVFGNLTFNNSIPASGNYPATFIGTSTLTNVTLVPGNNTLPMRSTVNQTLVIQSLATRFKDGMLPVDIVGTDVVYEGKHLPYYEEPFKRATQHIALDVGKALQALGVDASTLASLGGATGSGSGSSASPSASAAVRS